MPIRARCAVPGGVCAISQSFGATEQTFPSKKALLKQRSAFVNAAAHHISVLAASGDNGATDGKNPDGALLYTHRVNSWPSSDPLVTDVSLKRRR